MKHAATREEGSEHEKFSTIPWVGRRIGKLLLVLLFALHLFSIEYTPATGGLDPSWRYIINSGFDQRLEFSFTSGPLGFINYPLHIGNNLQIAMLVRLCFWVMFSFGFGCLVFKNRFPLQNLVVFTVLVSLGSDTSFDYLVCFAGLFLLSYGLSLARRWWLPLGGAVVLCAFLAMVKLSAALLLTGACIMFGLVMGMKDWRKGIRAAGMIVLGIPGLFLLMYLAYSPSLSSMLTYLKRAFDISSGYNVAMSISGPASTLWLALAIAVAYALHTAIAAKLDRTAGWLGLVYLPAFFFAFKHGYVRQDGHEAIFFAAVALLFALLWLFTPLTMRSLPILLLLIPVLLPYVMLPRYAASFQKMAGIPKIQAMQKVFNHDQTTTQLDRTTRAAWARYQLPEEWIHSIGEEAFSIFPWETAYAPANDLAYQPFPIIQAYSAYTAYLDSENAAFLADSPDAPDSIVMEWVAIDGRHLLLDVPDTWLELYRWYDVERIGKATVPRLLLHRRKQPRFGSLQHLHSHSYASDDFIEIPASEHPIAMNIHLKLTWFGQLMKLVFRVPEVTMTLVSAGGNRTYRVIPETLSNPVVINVLPFGIPDFTSLTRHSQWRNRVYGVRLSGPGASLYAKTIQVEFSQIPEITLTPLPVPDFDSLVFLGDLQAFAVERMLIYTPQGADSGAGSAFLVLAGWASGQNADEQPGGIYFTIDGTSYRAFHGFARPDLAQQFHDERYSNAGFYLSIPFRKIGMGKHTIIMNLLSHDRQGYYSAESSVEFTRE